VLGWRDRSATLADWLHSKTPFWLSDHPKPQRPKEALESALRNVRKQRSPRLYEELGKMAAVDRCKDPSFRKFRKVLHEWFGL